MGTSATAATADDASVGQSRGCTGAGVADSGVDLRRLPMTIGFGSQSGNAQLFAMLLQQDAESLDVSNELLDLSDFDAAALTDGSDKLLVLAMASFGDGEPTDNARRFFEWIHEPARRPDDFRGLRYALFGLGNSKAYPDRYQAVGRAMERRFAELGVPSVLPRGSGDDASGMMEEQFHEWKENLFQVLRGEPVVATDSAAAEGDGGSESNAATERDGATGGAGFSLVRQPAPEEIPVTLLPPSAESAPTSVRSVRAARRAADDARMAAAVAARHPFDHRTPALAACTRNDELHGEASKRSARHVEFDIAGIPGLAYETGDHVGIMPVQAPALVERFCERIGHAPDTVFRLEPPGASESEAAVCAGRAALFGVGSGAVGIDGGDGQETRGPRELVLGDLIANHLDLQAPPSRISVEMLSRFARDPAEAATLRQWSARSDDAEAYQREIIEERRGFAYLLKRFPSCVPPLGNLLDMLPKLQHRFYSISSSSLW